MKFLCLAFLALACVERTTAQFNFWGGNYGGNGYGCGANPPTIGFQCHTKSQDNTATFCRAQGSSTYRNPGYPGDYNAYLTVDGSLSQGNSGFYHSNLETYPYLRIQLGDITKPTDLTAFKEQDVARVEIYQRCDANELYHQTAFDVRGTKDPNDPAKAIQARPRLLGGEFCSTTNQVMFTGGTKFTVPCPTPITACKEVVIQKTTLHSHGSGWPNYNGNQWNSYTGNAPAQNSNLPVAFLMINEVVLY